MRLTAVLLLALHLATTTGLVLPRCPSCRIHNRNAGVNPPATTIGKITTKCMPATPNLDFTHLCKLPWFHPAKKASPKLHVSPLNPQIETNAAPNDSRAQETTLPPSVDLGQPPPEGVPVALPPTASTRVTPPNSSANVHGAGWRKFQDKDESIRL